MPTITPPAAPTHSLVSNDGRGLKQWVKTRLDQERVEHSLVSNDGRGLKLQRRA